MRSVVQSVDGSPESFQDMPLTRYQTGLVHSSSYRMYSLVLESVPSSSLLQIVRHSMRSQLAPRSTDARFNAFRPSYFRWRRLEHPLHQLLLCVVHDSNHTTLLTNRLSSLRRISLSSNPVRSSRPPASGQRAPQQPAPQSDESRIRVPPRSCCLGGEILAL